MKVKRRITRGSDVKWHYIRLLASIAKTNDTGLDDGAILAILNARDGQWSKAMSVEELLASMGIER